MVLGLVLGEPVWTMESKWSGIRVPSCQFHLQWNQGVPSTQAQAGAQGWSGS